MAVAVDVAETESVALVLVEDEELFEFARTLSGAVGDEFIDEEVISREVGDDFDDSVAVDIPASDGFDAATLIDVVDGPFGGFSFWVLTPSECLSPPAACDDIEVSVAVNVHGNIAEVVVVIFVWCDVADFVLFLEVWAGEPVFAGDDVEPAVLIDVEDGGGFVGYIADSGFLEGEVLL